MGKLTITFQYFENDRDLLGERLVSFLKDPLEFYYNDMTTVLDMLKFIRRKAGLPSSNPYEDFLLIYRCLLVTDDEYLQFRDPHANLFIALKYIGQVNGTIRLDWQSSIPGGASVGVIEGIRYTINTNESNHPGKPHVHVKYQDYRVSISLLDFSVLAGKLPGKIMKRAQKEIKHNLGFLISQWNKYSSGYEISMAGYYYDCHQKEMHPVPYG